MLDALQKWVFTTWPDVAMVLVSVVVVYALIIVYCRLVGLRSFSKMSAFDFAMTVAVGSLFASSISSPEPSLLLGIVAFGGLFAGQRVLGTLRQKSARIKKLVDNEPLLLMENGRMLEKNLHAGQVTVDDLRAKLREANVLNYSQVRAVVMETTGDITVLHTADPEQRLDPDLLKDVRRPDE
ncbi:MAG: DUF421 domain-containing protein [Phycisphaerae bacterium]